LTKSARSVEFLSRGNSSLLLLPEPCSPGKVCDLLLVRDTLVTELQSLTLLDVKPCIKPEIRGVLRRLSIDDRDDDTVGVAGVVEVACKAPSMESIDRVL